MITRTWRYLALVSVLLVVLVTACTQASAPAAPSAAKPAEPAASKPAEKPVEKATEKPAEKAAAKPAEQPAAKPAEKAVAKPAAPKDLPASIAVGTPPVGSSYNSVGTGVAKVVSDRSPVKAIVRPFAGPQAWMPLLESGEVHLGALNSMDAYWAYTGGSGFDKAYRGERLILRGNLVPSPTIAVRNDSDIKSLKDLKGKRIASDYGGHVFMNTSLTAYLDSVGLTWNDVVKVPVTDLNNGLKALREGRVDASFSGSPDTAATLEVDAAIGIRTLNLGDIPVAQAANPPKDVVDRVKKHLPAVDIVLVPKQGWMKSDNVMVTYPVVLAGSAKLSADAAYEVTKALYENDKELHPIYSWLAGWKQETMFDPATTIPYHDGSVRYWKEKGKWTPAAEENQKKVLGQ